MLYQYAELDCAGISVSPPCPESCPVCNTCMLLLDFLQDDIQDEYQFPINFMQGTTKVLPVALGIAAAVATLVVDISIHECKKPADVPSEVGAVCSGWRAYLGAINEN